MVDVLISETAKKQLQKLDKQTRKRIKDKLSGQVSENPERYIEPLTNNPHSKIRVGDYRIIVDLKKDMDELRIYDVGHRRNIYDR